MARSINADDLDEFGPDDVSGVGLSRADRRRAMSGAKDKDDLLDAAYKAGLKDAKHSAKRSKNSKVRRAAHATTRDIRPVVRVQTRQGLRTLAITLSVLALYLFLESAQAVSGVLGGIAKALAWLKDPEASIKYAK